MPKLLAKTRLRFSVILILSNFVMNVQEAGTYQSQNIGEDFFNKLPTDNRYISVGEQQFEPKSSIQVTKGS